MQDIEILIESDYQVEFDKYKNLIPLEKKLDKIIASNFSDGAKKKDEEEYEPVSSETLTPIVAHLLDVDGEEVEEYSEPVSELVSGVI